MNAELLNQPLPAVTLLALLGLLPFAFMSLTAFVKISTVLQIAKSAIGAQSVPSTTIVMALSATLTVLAMAPVLDQIGTNLEGLLEARQPTTEMALDMLSSIREPLREFLQHNAAPDERLRFLELARVGNSAIVGEADFRVLIPAFMVSELYEAFALGFALFLPFLVVDLVVGNVLLALGMQMMNPTQVSLPFKLLLFVAADGWGLLATSLVSSYGY